MSSDGTFVRAIAESFYHVNLLSYPGASPGFLRAIGGVRNYKYYAEKGWDPGPRHPFPDQTAFMFVVPFPYQALTAPLGPEMGAAAVCVWDSGPDINKALVFFTYRRSGRKPPADQHGRRPAPVIDVFGGWVGVEQIDPAVQITGDCNHPPQPITPTRALLPPSPGWPNSAE